MQAAIETFTIREIPNETFTVESVCDQGSTPHLKADQIRRGFTGDLYKLARVTEGTRKMPYSVPCIKSATTSEFKTLF